MGGPGSKVLGALLVALMAIGSVLMWLGFPFALIYGVSRAQESTEPSMGPYILVLGGILVEMVVMGKLLSALNRLHSRVVGSGNQVRVRLPWHRSMRGERDTSRPRTVLDVVMVSSVAVALALFAVWFFAFAGSSLPT